MELEEIKKLLPKKAVTEIAKRTGLSHSTVSLVLSGDRSNDLVIDTAIELAEENQQKIENRKKRLSNLLV